VTFQIKESDEDNVFESDSEDESVPEEESKESDNGGEEKINTKAPNFFPKSFVFSCIGVGLTNLARKTE